MVHTYTAKGSRQYRYYVCWRAQQQGWQVCETKSVSAQAIEDSVLDRIRALASDKALMLRVLDECRQQHSAATQEAKGDREMLSSELQRLNRNLARAATNGQRESELADLNERILAIEHRLATLRARPQTERISPASVGTALIDFTPVWEELSSRERALIVRAAIERITYDGRTGSVSVTYTTEEIRNMCDSPERKTA
jgi:site-specific DNA recombinase